MYSYHGTSTANAVRLQGGAVDVALGGGELGQGFYTGQFLHEAKTWAFHQSRDLQQNVVEFITEDALVEGLDFEILEAGTASLRRSQIRNKNETRTFLFGKDMLWAPIVGSERVSGDQYKWESTGSENLLNGADTTRAVI